MFSVKLVKRAVFLAAAYGILLLFCTLMESPYIPQVGAWNGPGGPTKKTADLELYIPHLHYHTKGHAYIIEHAMDVLENDGYRNWAGISRSFRQELLNGVRYADRMYGNQRIFLAFSYLGFGRKDLYEVASYPIAGQEHYFNPKRFNPNRREFKKGDRSGLIADEKKIFNGLGKLVNVLLKAIQHGIGAKFGAGILDPFFKLHFVLEPSNLTIKFPSAIENFELAYTKAVALWKQGWDGYWDSMFNLGMALHYLGDMAMVNHTFDSNFQNHSQYENYSDGKGNLPRFNASKGGKYISDKEPWEYLYLLADTIHNESDLKAVARGEFEDQLKKAMPLAEQYTAGLMARFFQDVGVHPKGSPVEGYVFSRDGKKLPGAYVFYKEAKDTGAWNYVRTDSKGKYHVKLIHLAKYMLRPAMPGYIFEGVALDEFHQGTYDIVEYSLYEDQRKDLFLRSLNQAKIAEAVPVPQGTNAQLAAGLALQKGLPVLPENQWVISHGGSSLSNPGFVTDSMAAKINRALLNIYPSNYSLGIDKGSSGFPKSTLVTLQLMLLANLTTGEIIQAASELEAVVKKAQTAATKPESEAVGSKLDAMLPQETLTDTSGNKQTAVSLIGAESVNNGFIEDNSILLQNGLVPVIPKAGIKVEISIIEQQFLPGIDNSIVVVTDDSGQAYFELLAGSNPGPITLRARIIENPFALQVKPEVMLQIMVQPDADKVDLNPPQLPTLSTSPFKHAVVASSKKTAGYTVSFEKGELTDIAKVAGAAAPSSWSKLWDSVGTVILGFNPIEKVTLVYATERSSGDIYRYVGRWEKIGDKGAMFVADFSGHLYGLSTDKTGVYEFSGTPGKWLKIGGAAGQILAGKGKLYATNPDSGDLYQYARSAGRWEKIGGPGAMFAADHSGALYGLSSDKTEVYKYSGTPGKWDKVGGAAGRIYAGGDKLYAANPDSGDIYHFLQDNGKWEKIGGPGKMFTVGFTGQIFGISPDGEEIFKYLAATGKWHKIGVSADRIAVGVDKIYVIKPATQVLFVRNLNTLDEAPSTLLGTMNKESAVKTEEASGYQVGLSGRDYGSGERIVARGNVYIWSTGRLISGQVLVYSDDKMIGYAKVINGHFSLYDLAPGNYQLRFTSYDGNKHAESNVTIPPDHFLIKIVLQAR